MVNANTIVTFNRVQTGIFEVLMNGVETDWEIYNGSMGESGRGKNVYGLYNVKTGKIFWAGTLASAKKNISYILIKRNT